MKSESLNDYLGTLGTEHVEQCLRDYVSFIKKGELNPLQNLTISIIRDTINSRIFNGKEDFTKPQVFRMVIDEYLRRNFS